MKFRKPISLLVLCIAALSLIATTCGIFSKQGPGEHYFTSIHGQTITIYGKGIYGNNSVSAVLQAIPQDIDIGFRHPDSYNLALYSKKRFNKRKAASGWNIGIFFNYIYDIYIYCYV